MRTAPAGFTLVELLVALTVSLLVTAAVFSIAGPSRNLFMAEAESGDMQQRLRVAADTLYHDLLMAGAGGYVGAAAGPLADFFAPVLPHSLGRVNTSGTFRNDVITVVYVPPTNAQTTITGSMPAGSGVVAVQVGPGCPLNDSVCGFHEGMTAMLYDPTGSFDCFRVDAVEGSELRLRHTMEDSSKVYPAGTRIVSAIVRSYYLKVLKAPNDDDATETFQLMREDGDGGAAAPVVDHVVAMNFEYFGDSAGAAMTAAELTDGPWRPDPGAPNRFDTDLLRIRRIVVSVRVESALDRLRGPAGALFLRSGTARGGTRWVPDQEIRFQVSPRNLNVTR